MADLQAGDRVRLVHMGNDPDPIPHGMTGTVQLVTELHFKDKEKQVLVAWDNGRSLSCICPPDVLFKLEMPQGGHYEFRWKPPRVRSA